MPITIKQGGLIRLKIYMPVPNLHNYMAIHIKF